MTARFNFTRRFEWTGRTLTMLCDRYGDGASFATVASELGCTRNAAIGRFNRLLDQHRAAMTTDAFTRQLADDWPLENIAHHARIPVAAVEARLAVIRRDLGPQAR